MALLEHRFSEADRQAINLAVRDAESRTSAEIIPVIAASSGRYDRSEDIAGLWTGIGCFVVAGWLVRQDAAAGSWGVLSPGWQLLICALAIVAGFVVGTLFASNTESLRRLFTPSRQMQDEVQQRARAIFFDQRVHHTQGATGILLYVSLFERIATVLADQAILQQVGQPEIEALCSRLTEQLHEHSPIAALEVVIREVGDHLSTTLPRAADQKNQLPDALVLLE